MGPRADLMIRDYRPMDREVVWELHVVGLEQFAVNAGCGPWDADVRDIPTAYFQNHGAFLVGECDGQVVAMGALRRVFDACAEIRRMRVHPDFQRRGFGSAILAALEERARVLGYDVLRLDTAVRQIPAQELYRKHGFREVGRAILGGFDSILFEKRLDAK